MEQHPVPQQISSYQFRLVGDMTLRQFLQLAGGALISLLIYATGLPALIKWPLVLFFFGAGAALAFLPFQERPLEQWVLAFFRSIYSPTLYYWQKPPQPPVYFQEEGLSAQTGEAVAQGTQPVSGFVSKLEEAEKSFVSQISQFFGSPTSQPITPTPASPVMAAQAQPTPVQNQTQPGQVYTAPANQPRELRIPDSTPVNITPTGQPPKPTPPPQAPSSPVTTQKVEATLAEKATAPAYAAQFSLDAAPPSPPTQPNTVTGQVMDGVGKIIEGAILEIQDEAGRPVRALKTNRAGHFIIVTPLNNGKYKIAIEKEGYIFDPIIFETKGQIIAPIAIRARGQNQ